MKSIWIVNHSSIPPELGGLNRHYYFSKYLFEMGYDIRIITASAIHNTDINIIGKGEKCIFRDKKFGDVVYTYLNTSDYKGNGIKRIINFIQFPWRLTRNYKKLDEPDLIYASSPSPFGAFAAIRIAKKMKKPVILEIRDLWPETIVAYGKYSKANPVIWLMYQMERWMYRNADRLIFTFEGGADYIKDKKWEKAIDISKILNINNGVDLVEHGEARVIPYEDDELSDTGTFKVVYTGSIRTSYRLGNLLDTAKIVAQTHPDIKFLIWGEGNEKETLKERCNKEGITNVYFKNRIEKHRIPSILAKADLAILHVNPLGNEKLGRYGCSHNKLFDYLASGTPIVSNFRPKYDLIESSNSGIVADSSLPEDLAKAIIKVYEMKSKDYINLCDNALKAAQEFDYKKLAKKLGEVIESTINGVS